MDYGASTIKIKIALLSDAVCGSNHSKCGGVPFGGDCTMSKIMTESYQKISNLNPIFVNKL